MVLNFSINSSKYQIKNCWKENKVQILCRMAVFICLFHFLLDFVCWKIKLKTVSQVNLKACNPVVKMSIIFKFVHFMPIFTSNHFIFMMSGIEEVLKWNQKLSLYCAVMDLSSVPNIWYWTSFVGADCEWSKNKFGGNSKLIRYEMCPEFHIKYL